jgi:hypothetical protein
MSNSIYYDRLDGAKGGDLPILLNPVPLWSKSGMIIAD